MPSPCCSSLPFYILCVFILSWYCRWPYSKQRREYSSGESQPTHCSGGVSMCAYALGRHSPSLPSQVGAAPASCPSTVQRSGTPVCVTTTSTVGREHGNSGLYHPGTNGRILAFCIGPVTRTGCTFASSFSSLQPQRETKICKDWQMGSKKRNHIIF